MDSINLTPSIDSRKIINPENTLFFAIKGFQNDAHNYIDELYKLGVKNFIIEDNKFKINNYPNANFKLVKNTINCFQEFAKKHRENFNIPIIAITGSNGKTIVKEWLFQLLNDDFTIAISPRSYNSQVGVPLSIFELKNYHNLGVFEAGISKTGEMEKLASIIQPNIGIFTNIGSAHSDGFKNDEEKIEEKLKLFENSELLIYNADNELVNKNIYQLGIGTISWSIEGNKADINYIFDNKRLIVSSEKFSLEKETINFQFYDKASIENICHCIAFLIHSNFNIVDINNKIQKLKSVSMRMELKNGENDCLIIDDSYNNDLVGLKTSLELFNQNNQLRNRTIIISDIYQTGVNDDELYGFVNEYITAFEVDKIIGIGKNIKAQKDIFKIDKYFFETTEDFLIADLEFRNEIILIKGSRSFQFEKISSKLVEKQHKAYLDVNLTSLIDNLNFYRSKLLPETKIMVMVKAFAYGSGIDEVANILQYNRVDYLAVAYADEGVRLRKKGIKIPIMVMNSDKSDFNNLINYDLEPEIYSLKILNEWVNIGAENFKPKIHIKLDTGMHRLGFEEVDLTELISIINANNIEIASVFSHLSTADKIDDKNFSNSQILKFEEFSSIIEFKTKQSILKHILNSSGIVNYNNSQYNMVRLGIGLYGVDPTYKNKLRNVVSLYGQISQIKHVKKGDTVGYGRNFILDKNIITATINLGYADGISRLLGNGKNEVFINGEKAKTIGNICMDMFMVDVTDVKCMEGDIVEIFGENIDVNILASNASTISYELLTSISERVKRIYYTE